MPALGDSIDRYVIEAVIGEGGMGRVYRALDSRLGRRVALKLLLAEGASKQGQADAAARMMREARAAAAFNHPNVVAIHDVGEFNGAPYITMELVSGAALRSYVGDASVSHAKKLEWLEHVARGLGAAHRAGLVHRDIKPENVMVTTDGVVKVLDFGIARRSEDPLHAAATAAAGLGSLTAEGMMIGTPQYMAPEQLQALPVDGRADQFAWGVMAWELFQGALPWGAGKNGAQLIAAVLSTPVPPLLQVAPGVSPTVSEVVARALSKDREGRFRTMEELLTALGAKAADTPTPQASPGLGFEATALQPATPDAGLATRPDDLPRARETPKPEVYLAESKPPSPRDTRRSVRRWVLLAGGLFAALGGPSVVERFQTNHKASWHGVETHAYSVASAEPSAPLMGLCFPGVKNDCSAGMRAWCDVDDHVVACCAPELAATGIDGVCDCPPGGEPPDAGSSSCPKTATSSGVPEATAMVTSLRPAFRACYNQGLAENEALTGRVVIEAFFAPDGRVYRARVHEGQMASQLVQRCLLDKIRKAAFAPPAGGAASLQIPITLVQHATDAAASADSGGQSASSGGRHPCRAKGSCSTGATAWCDAAEKELACCAPGLVAVGRDGMCDCPPGGVTQPVASCSKAKQSKVEWKKAVSTGPDGFETFMDCLHSGDAGRVWGSVQAERVFDPDGNVADVRVTRGSLPGILAQKCVLSAFRSYKAPPPPDGIGSDEVGFDLGKPSASP